MKNTDVLRPFASHHRIAATLAFCLALAGIAHAAPIVVSTPVDDGNGNYTWHYTNFTYDNISQIKNVADYSGFNFSGNPQQTGTGASGARWYSPNATSGYVTWTFDFSQLQGFSPDTITINTDNFRTFSGYTSTATLTGAISVDNGTTWETIYSDTATGSTNANSLAGGKSLALTALSDGQPISTVMYRFSFELGGSQQTGFIGYNRVANDGQPGLDITFSLVAIPEPSSVALGLGAIILAGVAGRRFLPGKR
ncbi:hypothetical protein OpiT1DRAFT_02420 [Opitutaceae bacterium TAV1]|nr:hypothetical protein OpiT1DRAFT_02420 [Opitutaceae bacterium TAV1]